MDTQNYAAMFTKKTFKVPREYTYTYYICPPSTTTTTTTTSSSSSTLPTLLFLHGFPDHAAMYFKLAHLLRHTYSLTNYQILIPDLLGYDGTSKPTDPSCYRFDHQTSDLASLLGSEHITSTIAIGHDWGSALAQRLYNFHPDLVTGLVLLNVAYSAPSPAPYDLAGLHAVCEANFGYRLFAYWELFTADDGADVLAANTDRFFSAMHAAGPDGFKDLFCRSGALRSYLTSRDDDGRPGEEVAVREYAQNPAARRAFVERIQRDGWEGPMCWYKVQSENHQYESEQKVPAENVVVRVPVLYIGCTEDAVCRAERIEAAKGQGLLPDLHVNTLEGVGHWIVYERPEETARLIGEWIGKKFGVGV